MLTKNLGTVRALHIGTTAPTNTAMLWYDTNSGVNIHKYYDTVSGTWIAVPAVTQVDYSLFDTWRTKVRSVGVTDPTTIPALTDGDRFIVGAGAVGSWAGQDNNIATRNGSGWDFETPEDSWAVLVIEDRGKMHVFESPNWVEYNILAQGDIQSNGTVPFVASQSMGGFNLVDLADPVNPQDAATKQWVEDQFTNSGFVPLAGTGVGAPITGDLEFDTSATAKTLVSDGGSVIFGTATTEMVFGSSSIRLGERGMFFGVGVFDPSTIGSGLANIFQGNVTLAPSVLNSSSYNLFHGNATGSMTLDGASYNTVHGLLAGTLSIEGNGNLINGAINGTLSVDGDTNTILGAINGVATFDSDSIHNLVGGFIDTITLTTGDINFLYGNLTDVSVDGSMNFLANRQSTVSLDSASIYNASFGSHFNDTWTTGNSVFQTGTSNGAIINDVSHSLIYGNVGNVNLDTITSSIIGTGSSTTIGTTSYSLIGGQLTSASIAGVYQSILFGQGSLTTTSLNYGVVGGYMQSANISGNGAAVFGTSTDATISATNSLVAGANYGLDLSGVNNFVFGGSTGPATALTIAGNNNFINQSNTSTITGGSNVVLRADELALTGDRNIIWDNTTGAAYVLKISDSLYHNFNTTGLEIDNVSALTELLVLGNTSSINGTFTAGNNRVFGQLIIDEDISTSGNTFLGNVSGTDVNANINNVYINTTDVIANNSNTVYVPSLTMHANGYNAQLDVQLLTGDRTHTLPDQSGTIALLSDIPGLVVGLWSSVVDGTFPQYTLTASGTDSSGNALVNLSAIYNATGYTFADGDIGNTFMGDISSLTFSANAQNSVILGAVQNFVDLGATNVLIGTLDGATTATEIADSAIVGTLSGAATASASRLSAFGYNSNINLTTATTGVTLLGYNDSISMDNVSNVLVLQSNGTSATTDDVAGILLGTTVMKTANTVYLPKIAMPQSGTLFEGIVTKAVLTADRTWSFPNQTGTVALSENLPAQTGVADPNGSVTPRRVGSLFINTLTDDIYVAKTTANNTWLLATNSSTGTDLTGTQVDNAIARGNGTDTIQSSTWFIGDTGELYPSVSGQIFGQPGNTVGNITMDGTLYGASYIGDSAADTRFEFTGTQVRVVDGGGIPTLEFADGVADTLQSFTRVAVNENGGGTGSDSLLSLRSGTGTFYHLELGAQGGTLPAPVDGHFWYDGSALNFYDGSTTHNLLLVGTSPQDGNATSIGGGGEVNWGGNLLSQTTITLNGNDLYFDGTEVEEVHFDNVDVFMARSNDGLTSLGYGRFYLSPSKAVSMEAREAGASEYNSNTVNVSQTFGIQINHYRFQTGDDSSARINLNTVQGANDIGTMLFDVQSNNGDVMGMVFDTDQGFVFNGNYSSVYSARSIVDKAYVDSVGIGTLISGSGTVYSTNTFNWNGGITEDVIIDGASATHSITFDEVAGFTVDLHDGSSPYGNALTVALNDLSYSYSSSVGSHSMSIDNTETRFSRVINGSASVSYVLTTGGGHVLSHDPTLGPGDNVALTILGGAAGNSTFFDGAAFGLKYSGDYRVNGILDDNWLASYGAVKDQIGGQAVDALIQAPTATEDGFVIAWNDTNQEYELVANGSGATGDVVGPASATDNAIARFDTTTGKLIQNSLVTISDTGNLTTSGGYVLANQLLATEWGHPTSNSTRIEQVLSTSIDNIIGSTSELLIEPENLTIRGRITHQGDTDTYILFENNDMQFFSGTGGSSAVIDFSVSDTNEMLKLTGFSGATVSTVMVNNLQNNTDFQVRTDNVATMLHVDASADAIRIGNGTTATALMNFAGSETTKAHINLNAGVNPTSPISGDLWYNGTNLYFRDGGTSVDLLAGGGGSTTLGGLTDVTITSPADGEVLQYDSGSGDWINAPDKRKIAVQFSIAGQITGSQQPLHIGAGTIDSWGNAGLQNNDVIPFTAPFDGTITKVIMNVREVNMNQAPGATNNVNVQFQFRDCGFDNGGTTLGSEVSIGLGANIGNFSGWQSIGSSGQGANRSATTSISVSEGDLIGLTFEGKFNTTNPEGIESCIITVIIEES